MAVLTALAIASTAFSIYGALNSAQSQAEAYDEQASLFERSALERRRRAEINAEIIQQQGDELIGRQMTAIAGSGRKMTGSAYSIIDDTIKKTAQEIMYNNEIAQYEIDSLQYKARMQEWYGQEAIRAGAINAVSMGLQGAFTVAQLHSSPGKGPTEIDKAKVKPGVKTLNSLNKTSNLKLGQGGLGDSTGMKPSLYGDL